MTPSPAGSKESLFSCTLTASEEAMAALEEVVLYAFQQCVYYLSKVSAAAMLLIAALLGPWGRREWTGMSQLQQGGSSHWFRSGPWRTLSL